VFALRGSGFEKEKKKMQILLPMKSNCLCEIISLNICVLFWGLWIENDDIKSQGVGIEACMLTMLVSLPALKFLQGKHCYCQTHI